MARANDDQRCPFFQLAPLTTSEKAILAACDRAGLGFPLRAAVQHSLGRYAIPRRCKRPIVSSVRMLHHVVDCRSHELCIRAVYCRIGQCCRFGLELLTTRHGYTPRLRREDMMPACARPTLAFRSAQFTRTHQPTPSLARDHRQSLTPPVPG